MFGLKTHFDALGHRQTGKRRVDSRHGKNGCHRNAQPLLHSTAPTRLSPRNFSREMGVLAARQSGYSGPLAVDTESLCDVSLTAEQMLDILNGRLQLTIATGYYLTALVNANVGLHNVVFHVRSFGSARKHKHRRARRAVNREEFRPITAPMWCADHIDQARRAESGRKQFAFEPTPVLHPILGRIAANGRPGFGASGCRMGTQRCTGSRAILSMLPPLTACDDDERSCDGTRESLFELRNDGWLSPEYEHSDRRWTLRFLAPPSPSARRKPA